MSGHRLPDLSTHNIHRRAELAEEINDALQEVKAEIAELSAAEEA